MNVTGKLCQLRQALRNCRNLHVASPARNASAYEGPGKTTVTFISKEIGPRILVSHCNENGFTLNTGHSIIGPTILFPRQALCWSIASGKYINEATLSLITVLEPKPDLLIIGLDDKYDFSHIRKVQELVQKHNISVEIVSVLKACMVYNFVNEEGRYVIAALIPPKAPRRLMLPKNTRRATKGSEDSKNERENSVRTDAKLE